MGSFFHPLFERTGIREPSATERLKREPVSLLHLLTHSPTNPLCPTCNWAKALRKQQRKAKNKGYRIWDKKTASCRNPKRLFRNYIDEDELREEIE